MAGSTRSQYDELIADLKERGAIISDEIIYDTINYRAFVCDLDECERRLLYLDSIVSTISSNALGYPDERDDDATVGDTVNPRGLQNKTIERRINPETIKKRINTDAPYLIQPSSPYQLGWFSSPWAKTALPDNTCKSIKLYRTRLRAEGNLRNVKIMLSKITFMTARSGKQ